MKNINQTITRQAVIRKDSVDEENRTATFVISTEAVDTYGTVFLASGWDFTRYNDNPVVFFQHGSHSSDPDMLIGTSRIFQEGKETLATVTFEAAEDNPLAEKVFRKVKNGSLKGASIGANIKQGRWGVKDAGEDPEVIYFERQELLEWSIVTIPSNPDALKRNTDTLQVVKDTLPKENTEQKRALSSVDAQIIINQNTQLR